MNTEQLKTTKSNEIRDKIEELIGQHPALYQLLHYFESELEKDRESRWISVKERLPEIEDADMKGKVLGWDKIQKETHKCNFQDICQMKMRFTHWQSLPLPPEK